MEPNKHRFIPGKFFLLPTNFQDVARCDSKSIRNWSYWSFLTIKCEISSYKILRQIKFCHWRQKNWVPYEVKTKNLQKIWKWSNIKIGKTSLTEGFQPSSSGFVSTIKLLEIPEESKYYRSNVYTYQKNECNAGNEQEGLKWRDKWDVKKTKLPLTWNRIMRQTYKMSV